MALKRFAGCVLHGDTLADRPTHASYWTDWKFIDLQKGDEYYDNGSAWVLWQGATKSEILQNKEINPLNNNVSGLILDPFVSNKREGWIIPAASADASLHGCLKGMPSVGTYSLVYDATEGWHYRLSTSLQERFGLYSVAIPMITRRAHAPKLKIRSKLTANGNIGYWFGFSNTLPQLSGLPFPNSAHFAVVGMSHSYTTNFQIVTNDGTNDSGNATSTGVSKGAAISWNTYEISMTDTQVIAKIGATEVIVTTRLPSLNQDLYLMMFCYNNEAVAKNFDIVKGHFVSDLT